MSARSAEPGREPNPNRESVRGEVHLRDYLAIAYKRLSVILVTAVTVFVFMTLPEAQKPRKYSTSASLLVKPPSRTIFNTQGASYYLMSLQDFQTQLYLMKSKKVALQVIEHIVESPREFDLLHELGYARDERPAPSDWDALANRFRARLTVTPVPDTYVVNLSYSGSDPGKVQRLLHLYCKLYVKYNGDRDRQHLEASERQLDLLQPRLEKNVDDQIGRKRELIKNSPSSQHLFEYEQRQIDGIGAELAETQAERRQIISLIDRLRAVIERVPAVAADSALKEARAQLARIHSQREAARSRERDADQIMRILVQIAAELPSARAQAAVSTYRSTETFESVGEDVDSLRSMRFREILESARREIEDLLLGLEPDGSVVNLLLVQPEIAEFRAAEGEPTLAAAWQALESAQAAMAALPISAAPAAMEEQRQALDRARATLVRVAHGAIEFQVNERRRVSAAALEAARSASSSSIAAAEAAINKAALEALRATRLQIIDSPNFDQLLGVVDLLADAVFPLIIAELQGLEIELAEARARALAEGRQESDVRYIEAIRAPTEGVRQKRLQVFDQIVRAFDTRILTAEDAWQRIASLREVLDEQIVKVARGEISQTDFARIAFNIDTAQGLFKSAVQEHQRIKFDSQLLENNVSLVEEPREPGEAEYFEPDIRRAMLIGIVFGLVAGFGMAFVLEYLDDTIKTASDIDRYIGAPILGAIPTMVNKAAERKDLICFYEPKASISEAFRSVRTSLLFTSSDVRRDTFVVTSVGPREGKTTVSVNLAITLAQAGSRTLLIDCDLRRPRVHKAFGIRENLGLTNVLVGGGAISEFAKQTDVPNLFLLTSGPIPPNPSELVGGRRMREFFEEARGQFDKVIYDTPPLAAVTDGVIVGGLVDGLVLVISSAKTTKKLAQRAREQLDNVGVPIFGVVLNNVKATHGYYYYSSYYRYYGEDAAKS